MKTNRTQAALDMAAAVRAFAAQCKAANERESIRPLERRRVARLAGMIAAAPVAAFDNRRDCQ